MLYAQKPATAGERGSPPAQPQGEPCILVAEDNPVNQMVVRGLRRNAATPCSSPTTAARPWISTAAIRTPFS